jgi:hypothetical protein
MKANLSEYISKVRELSEEKVSLKSRLRSLCSESHFYSISRMIHILNSELYETLRLSKDRKLKHLREEQCLQNVSSHKTVITIPEDLELSSMEKSVLSKGLKFVPSKSHVNKFNVECDLASFYRRIKLRAYFNSDNNTTDNTPVEETNIDESLRKFKPKSTWTPMDDFQSSVHKYITVCRNQISALPETKPIRKNNLSKEEQNALQELRMRKDVVIKPADKGGAIVVWQKDLYMEEVQKQLNNPEFYEKMDYDQTHENAESVKNAVSDEIAKENLPPEAQNLIINKPRTSQFYVLPKVHKPGNPGRPIVSACSCPTERISAFIDDTIQPIVESLPSYTKNSTHALKKVLDHPLKPDEPTILFTMDVKSLYTIIPHQDGLEALRYFLNKRAIQNPPTSTIIRLAELVLTLNSFECNGEFYHQTRGVAMGTRMGPTYANLFMGFLEEQMQNTFTGSTPEIYMRYIDDVFGLTQMRKEQLISWMEHLKSLHPAVEYTSEISEERVTFLDAEFFFKDGAIHTTIHYKPTDSHSYLQYTSFHPKKTKDSDATSPHTNIN